MADANLIAIKRFHRCRNEVNQFEPSGDEGGLFSSLCGDLLNRVGRLFQIQQGLKSLCFLHRVNVGANQVFDQLGF
jgi:hypothetical protein